MKQQTLTMSVDQPFESYRNPTRRDEFLETMEAIIPWSALCEVIVLPPAENLYGLCAIADWPRTPHNCTHCLR